MVGRRYDTITPTGQGMECGLRGGREKEREEGWRSQGSSLEHCEREVEIRSDAEFVESVRSWQQKGRCHRQGGTILVYNLLSWVIGQYGN